MRKMVPSIRFTQPLCPPPFHVTILPPSPELGRMTTLLLQLRKQMQGSMPRGCQLPGAGLSWGSPPSPGLRPVPSGAFFRDLCAGRCLALGGALRLLLACSWCFLASWTQPKPTLQNLAPSKTGSTGVNLQMSKTGGKKLRGSERQALGFPAAPELKKAAVSRSTAQHRVRLWRHF